MRLLVTIALGEAHLDAGDVPGALRVLDRRLVWQQREVQSLARLCAAALADEPIDELAQLRKRMLLSTYVSIQDDKPLAELPLRFGAWSLERLNELGNQAIHFLNGWYREARAAMLAKLQAEWNERRAQIDSPQPHKAVSYKRIRPEDVLSGRVAPDSDRGDHHRVHAAEHRPRAPDCGTPMVATMPTGTVAGRT